MKIIKHAGDAEAKFSLLAETQAEIEFLDDLSVSQCLRADEGWRDPQAAAVGRVMGVDVSLGASAVKTLGGRIVIDVLPDGAARACGEFLGGKDWVSSMKTDKQMRRDFSFFYEEMRRQVDLGRRLNVDEHKALRESMLQASSGSSVTL